MIRQTLLEEKIERIAVFRALYLGDFLLAVPALRSLRAGFPRAEITLIALPWARPLVRRFSHSIDRFVAFEGYPGLGEVEAQPERAERFLEEQRAHGYDLVIQMHGSGKSSLPFCLALDGRFTVGYYVDGPPAGLTAGAPYPEDRSELLRNLDLVRLIGCPDRGAALEFPLLDADRLEARRLLDPLAGASGPRIGLHPGASSLARRWPAPYFARLGDALVEGYGAEIVVTGGPGEEERIAREVAQAMRFEPLVLAGRTSLGGLAAVIAQLDLYISNDTGPAHLTEAVGTPSVTIFGPEDPRRWASLDRVRHPAVRNEVACNPCDHTDCPIDHHCIRGVNPEAVLAVAHRLLSKEAVA